MRCQTCSRSSDGDFGGKTHFMVCSTCKSKLDFSVHYCSQKCQKVDWPDHKPNCGKKKVIKVHEGTSADDNLRDCSPEVAALLKDVPIDPSGTFNISSIGSGEPRYQRSSALQYQVSLIDADKEVEYVLFTPSGFPIRFFINNRDDYETWTRINFRIVRKMAMSSARQDGLAPMAEHLIKHAENLPGLSRDIIMRQLCAEYGAETETKVSKLEKQSALTGHGLTLVESMSRLSTKVGPRLAEKRSKN
ncbi:hypothetical protein SERLA73DRAFT_145457, partial [Serpula lacrymans var. lacrymans S7.3]